VGRLKIALISGLVIALAGCGSSARTIRTDKDVFTDSINLPNGKGKAGSGKIGKD
jgi:uncharacterized lipoprotein